MFKNRIPFVVIAIVTTLAPFPGNPPIAQPPSTEIAAGETQFAVIGDYGNASQSELDVANLVKSWNPDFVITLGDNNYGSGSAATIDQNIGQYYHEFIFPYTGSYGAGAASNQFFPSLGNHDWETTNAQPYLDYFTLPGNERYYDFVKGPVHFFVIDSDSREPDGTNSSSIQAAWLQNALTQSTSDWNIVYFHHPPYSSGLHGSNPSMQWPFALWGAHVVLSGHDHDYERILRKGIPYFVNGAGGNSLYPFGVIVAGSQARYNRDYGAMLINANSTTITIQMIARSGAVVDKYILDKSDPHVGSVVRADTNPSASRSVDFTVTFSEAVTGVNASDFTLTASGVSNSAVSGVSGSGIRYTVRVDTGSGSGTIRLNIPASATINDLSSNSLDNLPFTSGQAYTIKKSLTLKSAAAHDGWVLESTETSNTGGTMNSAATLLYLGDNAQKKQYRSILSFDTASLPDNAVLTKITLKLKQQGIAGGGNPVTIFQGFVVDIKNGVFGAAPLALTDFKATASKTVGPASPSLTSGWYNLNLINGKDFINKLGLTQIRLRFKLDDNNNAIANFLKIYSGNAGAANRPQLVIEYTVP